MTNFLIAKLEQFARLSRIDRAALDALAHERVRHYEAREDIIREGDDPHIVRLMLSGWACRYKQLHNGRRQIIAFFLPGDLCDHNVFILRRMDHSVGALTPVTVAEITPSAFEQLTLNYARVTQALWWETLVNAAIQREWTTNLGQRDAAERLSHLLCELFYRLRGVGLTDDNSCELPVTQVDFADATGMTPVHVNRSLQELRAEGLIVLRQRRLTIPDLPALQRRGLFSPNYLHLDHVGRQLDAKEE